MAFKANPNCTGPLFSPTNPAYLGATTAGGPSNGITRGSINGFLTPGAHPFGPIGGGIGPYGPFGPADPGTDPSTPTSRDQCRRCDSSSQGNGSGDGSSPANGSGTGTGCTSSSCLRGRFGA